MSERVRLKEIGPDFKCDGMTVTMRVTKPYMLVFSEPPQRIEWADQVDPTTWAKPK